MSVAAVPAPPAAAPGRLATRWRDRILTALQYLAVRPAPLFTVLWAANAVRFPYGNLIHDARLYAFQVQNQMSRGAFAGDLFLRFGSQDQYTPFSRLVAPIAAVFGIDWTFFALFLVFNALLILGLQRLVMALLEDRLVATAGLLAVVFAALPYGGLGIFHVFEFFFTPRLISCAFVLFALERILRRRYISGLAIAAAATVVHPLMGFGGVAIGLSCALLDLFPKRVVVPAIAMATAAGIAILAYRPLGTIVFGTIDPEWLEVTRQASAYNFPGFWTTRDWVNVALSIGLPAWAAIALRNEAPHRARFLGVSAVLGAAGVVTMFVAGAAPYRLLLQGQPYRILWILAAIQIPIAFWVAGRLWSRGLTGQMVAILLITSPQLANSSVDEVVMLFVAISLFLIVLNRPTAKVVFSETFVPAVVAGMAVGFLVSAGIRFHAIGIRTSMLLSLFGMKTYAEVLLNAPGPMMWVAALLCGLGLVIREGGRGQALAGAAALVAVAFHTAAFLVPRLPAFRDTEGSYGRDLAFISGYMEQRHHYSIAPPAIYDGIWESSNLVWFDLHATDYFNLVQMSGVLFNRDTATEGRRRAAIVRPFELERYRAIGKFLPWGDTLMITSLFGPAEQAAPPALADVMRLCSGEESIDVAILKHDFEGLAAATNGRVYLYECADVRTARRQ